MKLGPKVHDWYVGRVVMVSVVAAWAVLLGLDALSALMTELGNIGEGRYDFTAAVAYVMLTLPRRIYYLFPYAAVVGSLLGLGQLAAASELTALRALGLSRRRVGVTVAAALAVLTALMLVNGETLSVWGQRKADGLKASARSDDMIVAQYSGLWAREGNSFLNAQTGQEHNNGSERWLELRDIRLYEFAEDGRLESTARAASAEHRAGAWLLRNVQRTWFEAKAINQTDSAEERWESELDANTLAATVARPRYLRMHELRDGIDYRKRNGLEASQYEEHYWGRWFYPVNVLALCLAAIPFAFGSLRSGGLGKRLFIGIVFSLGFLILQMMALRMAAAFHLPYPLVYAMPIVMLLSVSALVFARRSG